jgi:glycosyltransferase involved in cell wall biosynthesis
MYQTYKDWEVIIVDDYSELDCIQTIQDWIQEASNITLVTKTSEPRGASVSRNIGLAKAVGAYVLFLDADDLLAPFALEQRINVFEKQKEHLDAVMAPTIVFSVLPSDCQKVWHPFDNQIDPLESFIKGNSYFHTMSGLWDKTFLNKIGGWDNGLSSYQDWEFHVRALLQNVRYKEVQEYDNF